MSARALLEIDHKILRSHVEQMELDGDPIQLLNQLSACRSQCFAMAATLHRIHFTEWHTTQHARPTNTRSYPTTPKLSTSELADLI